MEADFRVDSIFVDEELGEMFAKCYDNVYGEEFEKFLGSPDTEEGRQNALTILEDSTYTMTDELRNEFISTFGLDDFGQEIVEVEEEDEFYDDSEDEVVETFSIREALNKIDLSNDNKYDLLNLYESCILNENEKRELGKLLYDQADSSVIYDTLNKKYISEHYDDCPELYDDLFGKLEDMDFVINKTLNLSEDELDGEYVDETLDTLEDFVDEAKDIVDDIKEHKDLDEDLDKETLKSKLEKATREFVTNTLGYDDDFVDDYIFVEVKEDKFSDGSEAIKCEIRTELDYEECVDLSTHLNPILYSEDKYAYFDMEDANTLTAYLRTDFSDDVVDEETVNEYSNLIKDISNMEELRKFYREIKNLFEDIWSSATFEKVHDLIMDKADELNKDVDIHEEINESNGDWDSYKDMENDVLDAITDYADIECGGCDYDFRKGYIVCDFLTDKGQVKFKNYLYEHNIPYHEATFGRIHISIYDLMNSKYVDKVREDKFINESKSIDEGIHKIYVNGELKDEIESSNPVHEVDPIAYKYKKLNGVKEVRVEYADGTTNTMQVESINESKSINEDFYRGNKSVQYIGHGEWNDPELEYRGYLFNYWDIENALWNDFLDETGYSDAQSDDPTVESQFNKFVQDRASDLLDDCIYDGSFTGLSVEGEIMNFPNDDYFYVGYDYKTEELSLDNAYNTGRTPEYSIKYDFSKSVDENLQRLYDHAIEKSPWLNGDDDLDESVEDEPYTKEEIERDLKSITHNFTDKDGELKCGFVEEKNFGVEILKQHYKVVETSGDDRRGGTWYHISFANPIEDKSTNEGYELLSGNKVEVYSDYDIAKKRAEELGLKEAEYGDIYRSNYSYCFWNEAGDSNDEEQVIAYYTFENGKPRPLTEDEREDVIHRYEIGSFDNENLEEDMDTYDDNSFARYEFPLLTDEDRFKVKSFGLQIDDETEDSSFVSGSYKDLKDFANNWLGYELHPDYLYVESLKESITHSPLSTAGPIPYAVKLLYIMDKFVLDVYDNEYWLMDGVPDGEFEETTPDEAMQNYEDHKWLITDSDGEFDPHELENFVKSFRLATDNKNYDKEERSRIIDEADTFIREYAKHKD